MDIAEKFDAFYSAELEQTVHLPERISSRYLVSACLKSTGDKEIYLLARRDSSEQVVLKLLPFGRHEANQAEYRLLSSLDHPRIPKAVELFEEGNTSCMIRTYVPGVSLHQWIALHGAAADSEAVHILEQLCDLLTYLHTRQPPVIHRDIKPQNVILSRDGTVYLIDFDIARVFNPAAATDTIFIGTSATAPPEQYGYAQTDAKSDIFSLGMLLIFLCTGRCERIAISQMQPHLRKIAEKATQFSPEDRYATASRFKKDLFAASRGASRRIALGVLSLCVIAGSFFTGILFGRNDAANVFRNTSQGTGSLHASTVQRDAVIFADAMMEKVVREKLHKSPGEPVTVNDLLFISELTVTGIPSEHRTQPLAYKEGQAYQDGQLVKRGGIQTLSDLSLMAGLRTLTLKYQMIDDLSPLRELHLTELILEGNYVLDVEPLKNMETLQALNLNYNPISDISPLAGLSRLESLYFSQTNVSDIAALSNLLKLRNISLNAIPCGDYSPLFSLTNLQTADIALAPSEVVSYISQIAGLRLLNVNSCSLLSLDELDSMPELDTLFACNMQIESLEGIERFPMLRDLELSNDPISDLIPLKALAFLEVLDLRNTGSGLDLSPLLDIHTLKRLIITEDMNAQAERIKDQAAFEIVVQPI